VTGRLPPSGSLRLRFLLAILLWVSLGIFGIWFTANGVFTKHIEEAYHEELEVHVRELARLTQLDENGDPRLTRPLSDPRYEVPLSGFYWQVTVQGREPLRSESMTTGQLDQRVAHSPDIAHEVEDGPTGPTITYGLLETGPGDEEIHIVIATDQSELDEDIASFTRELFLWLVSLGALLLATGFAIISFGLRPLNRLGEAINRLRSGQADKLEGQYPSEIAPLVHDLNEYIAQTSDLVERARVQAGNLAHSLRTPLAVVTDEAEQLGQNPDCQKSSRVLLEQTERMQQQIDYQLARARSAAGARLPGSRSLLPAILMPIISAMERLHRDKAFTLLPMKQPFTVAVDPVNLGELVSILLDNAGKWARSNVEIAVRRNEVGRILLTISDDGPGMREEDIAGAFEIGSRFDLEMPGSGLGLAMAKDIATAIGAEIDLLSSGEGLVATVTLSADL